MKFLGSLIACLSLTCNFIFSAENNLNEFYEKAKLECQDITSVQSEMDRINDQIVQLLVEHTAYIKRAGDLKFQALQFESEPKGITEQERRIISKSIQLELPVDISVPTFRMIMETSIEFQEAYIDHLSSYNHN